MSLHYRDKCQVIFRVDSDILKAGTDKYFFALVFRGEKD